MSVVAVRVTTKKIEIAADSIMVKGYTKTTTSNSHSKLCQTNNIIIGSTGHCDESSLLQIFCKTRKPKSACCEGILDFITEFSDWKNKKTDEYGINNEHFLVYNNKVFEVHGLFVQEVKEYSAIGIGEDFAMAALYLGKTAKEACKVACELSCFCSEPLQVITVKCK